ncbi:hypothetical protein ACTXQV_57975, partial [Klebsiella pneumoniae]
MTKNYSFEDGLEQIAALITQCKQANLFSTHQEIQLKKIRKKPRLIWVKSQTWLPVQLSKRTIV